MSSSVPVVAGNVCAVHLRCSQGPSKVWWVRVNNEGVVENLTKPVKVVPCSMDTGKHV